MIYEVTGQALDTVWDMKPVDPKGKQERRGYPTQKPLALYERVIKASSNKGNMVLDPFAGRATTCVAAERLERQWVGMDIWNNAKKVVLSRVASERLALPEAERGDLFAEEMHFTDAVPIRTDDGDAAAPFLRVKQRVKEPEGQGWTRAEMYEHLLDQNGPRCEGCSRMLDDPRNLELDHNIPCSDGGINQVSTLSGLRRRTRNSDKCPRNDHCY